MSRLGMGKKIAIGVALLASGCETPDGGGAEAELEVVSDELTAGVCQPGSPVIDPERSLAVTDLAILDSRFSFERVMTALVASAGQSGDGKRLYQQWWDTQNDAASAQLPNALHCNGTLNGFDLQCPRNEGQLADLSQHDPYCTGPGCDPYTPIGLFNRFDLAAADGSTCGEYRIIFGKDGAIGGRNLIIFEAELPNPDPTCGVAACRPIAQFWARLSRVNDPARRARLLEAFYFEGIDGFGPIITWENFAAGSGQIRTNQFMTGPNTRIWQLREFELRRACAASGACRLVANQVSVKANPNGELFDPSNPSALAAAFQSSAGFPTQVASLAVNDLNGFGMAEVARFANGQSTSQFSANPALRDADYPFWFGAGPSTFRDNIQTALTAAGSGLTPDDIVNRAQAMSCGGCHQLSNNRNLGGGLTWPASLGFVHVSEQQTEACGSGTCFRMSDALHDVFLPARQQHLADYLNATPCSTTCSPLTAAGASARTAPLRVH